MSVKPGIAIFKYGNENIVGGLNRPAHVNRIAILGLEHTIYLDIEWDLNPRLQRAGFVVALALASVEGGGEAASMRWVRWVGGYG